MDVETHAVAQQIDRRNGTHFQIDVPSSEGEVDGKGTVGIHRSTGDFNPFTPTVVNERNYGVAEWQYQRGWIWSR